MLGKTPRIGPSLLDTARVFASEKDCHTYLEAARWPNGVKCLRCASEQISKFVVTGKSRVRKDKSICQSPDRYMYQCMNSKCKYQFSATTGTLFGDSHVPLSKWMLAVALMCNAKKGMSAKQLERDLDVSYKTAWFLCHRIRSAMAYSGPDQMSGIVEADATFIGGKYD